MAEGEGERAKERESIEREQGKIRKLTVEEEMEIARIIEEKQDEEEDLIEIRIVEEIVFRRFHKYLKVFEKKELERMLMRKTWDHAIDLREGFVPKKGKIYLLSRIKRKEVWKFVKNQLKKGYIRLSKSL